MSNLIRSYSVVMDPALLLYFSANSTLTFVAFGRNGRQDWANPLLECHENE